MDEDVKYRLLGLVFIILIIIGVFTIGILPTVGALIIWSVIAAIWHNITS